MQIQKSCGEDGFVVDGFVFTIFSRTNTVPGSNATLYSGINIPRRRGKGLEKACKSVNAEKSRQKSLRV
jgi:hypothetical protein